MRNGYRLISIDGAKFLEHRVIYAVAHGAIPDGCSIDHIDHDHKNSRIENLRACSHAENLMNQPGRGRKERNDLPKHVYWSKRERKFKVYLRANGRRINIGTYAAIAEATEAAANAVRRLHGEFSYRGAA